MTVIERLNDKKDELETRKRNLYHGGSNRRETLEYKIKKIEELITAYHSTSVLVDLLEAEKLLDQQVGFEKQKEKILNNLKIKDYCEQNNVQKDPLILCLVGPPGVGKTTFSRILAQALKKKFFTVALGGMTDNSLLVGANESSLGTEIGQLTKALAETRTHDPLILLDEIDKVGSYGSNSVVHNCLSAVLDPVQNKEILDYYLNVKLDFSKVIFVITANDHKKIPDYLLLRAPLVVKLPGYNTDQKKAIANQFVKKWFEQNPSLNQNKFEITPDALEKLIRKTKEEGVRQLKSALDNVFDHCLLQWAEEARQGKLESKIKIDIGLIDKIIPCDFFNVDQNPEDNDQEKIKRLWRNLEESQRENSKLLGRLENKEEKLVKIKKIILLILQRNKESIDWKNHNYEEEVKQADSWEELQVIKEEILLQIRQKLTFKNKEKSQTSPGKLKELEKLVNDLTKKMSDLQKFSNLEKEKLKKEVEGLQNQGNKNNTFFSCVVIVALIIWGFYELFKMLVFVRRSRCNRK